MTKRVIDGIIKDWGEQLYYSPVKGRKGKNIRGGSQNPSTTPPKAKEPVRATIARTAKRVPEVMVKISGGGKNMQQIKAHMDYISRHGKIELEDERGDIYLGKDEVNEVRDAWAKGKIGIPLNGEKRKEAFNIILSMPPGTDRVSVKNAVRAFAAKEFANHQYIFANHEDEKHPHVHLAVKAIGHNGVRLNPRKADLQQWREQFAEQLREQGLEANATRRMARGVVRKAEKQAVRHINEEFAKGKRDKPARVEVAQKLDAEREAATGQKHINPAREKIKSVRKDVVKKYGHIARTLVTGDAEDRALALQIVGLVKQMPPPVTKHQVLVKRLSHRPETREIEPSQERTQSNNENER